jgi:carbon monoxide dehydrogenase subunit G
MNATVTLRVGPVKARFKGSVTLQDLDPPAGYVIVGEGKGGPAGFAKGRAEVKLAEDGQGTILSYAVKVQLGGKMAQIGGRLMEGTTRKLSGQFFEKFSELVAEGEAGAAAAEPSPSVADTKSKDGPNLRLIAIVGIVVVVAVLFATLT